MQIRKALPLQIKEVGFHLFVREDSYHEIIPAIDPVSHLDSSQTIVVNKNYFKFELCISSLTQGVVEQRIPY